MRTLASVHSYVPSRRSGKTAVKPAVLLGDWSRPKGGKRAEISLSPPSQGSIVPFREETYGGRSWQLIPAGAVGALFKRRVL